MKILKDGDLNRVRGIRRFECPRCGCIFEADNKEYTHEYSQREACGWYSIQCPTCKWWITQEDDK